MFDLNKITINTGNKEINFRPMFTTMVLPKENQCMVTFATPGFDKKSIKMQVVHYDDCTALTITSTEDNVNSVANSVVFANQDRKEIAKCVNTGFSCVYTKPIEASVTVAHNENESKIEFNVDYVNGMIVVLVTEIKLEKNETKNEVKFESDKPSKQLSKRTKDNFDRIDDMMKKYFGEDNYKSKFSDGNMWFYGHKDLKPGDKWPFGNWHSVF